MGCPILVWMLCLNHDVTTEEYDMDGFEQGFQRRGSFECKMNGGRGRGYDDAPSQWMGGVMMVTSIHRASKVIANLPRLELCTNNLNPKESVSGE
ncbi:hypothetical protein BS17DRAFT_422351 [Gyrodon lividus]|nr:hypothetical protein BS17DRAFT_422351 [Gyrodon lividus]